jgi:hypothetical protein
LENRLFMMVERSTIRRATSYKESHTVLWKVKDKVSLFPIPKQRNQNFVSDPRCNKIYNSAK